MEAVEERCSRRWTDAVAFQLYLKSLQYLKCCVFPSRSEGELRRALRRLMTNVAEERLKWQIKLKVRHHYLILHLISNDVLKEPLGYGSETGGDISEITIPAHCGRRHIDWRAFADYCFGIAKRTWVAQHRITGGTGSNNGVFSFLMLWFEVTLQLASIKSADCQEKDRKCYINIPWTAQTAQENKLLSEVLFRIAHRAAGLLWFMAELGNRKTI